MGTFSVRVIYDDGEPASDIKVFVDFGTFGGHSQGYTDDEGWVEFENHGNRNASFIIDNEEYEDYDVSDGESYSFTI